MALPLEVTSFVGRRSDVAAVKRLLAGARLVTLTGVGGVGKSRLALRVASQLRRAFPDGVCLVDLAELSDPSLLTHSLLKSLDVRDDSGRDPRTVLAEHLAERNILLLLDNCEHLVEVCAELITALLRAAPLLRVLATSRERLATVDEHVWNVRPLELPDPQDALPPGAAEQFPALNLFAERANAAEPSFGMDARNMPLVASICRLLDGVPLAIELAAVRVRVLTLQQLHDGLAGDQRLLAARGTGPARQQTLYAAAEWSYRLCTPSEQDLWARISVFVGGFDLAAAVAVCADTESVADTLAGLIDKSVVLREDGSFRLLDPLRQYGLGKLREAGAVQAMRCRHRDYYLGSAEQGERDWFGPHQPEIFERLRAQHANIRAALEFSLSDPDGAGVGLHMSAALGYYWTGCGVLGEGRHWLDRALMLNPAPTRTRAKALWVNGYVATLQGDLAAAVLMLEEARTIAAELDDARALAYATHRLGCTYLVGDDIGRAASLFVEAQERYLRLAETNSSTMLAWIEHAIALVFTGDFAGAATACDYAHSVGERFGERWAYAYAIYVRALIAFGMGEFAEAREYGRECLRIKRTFQDLLGIVLAIEILAWTAAVTGQSATAATLLGATGRIWRSVGYPLFGSQYFGAPRAESQRLAAQALGEKDFAAATEQGSKMDLHAAVAFALGEFELRPAYSTGTSLTTRELEVAELVAQGLTNRAVAARLGIAPRTAESHVERVLQKLGFSSRSQIASWMAPQR